jgi:SAM-dependent methyltransferase
MYWVKDFYSRQEELSGVYSVPVDDSHRRRANRVTKLIGSDSGVILELGAGGGQNAAALAMLGFDVTAVDIADCNIANINKLIQQHDLQNLSAIHGNFYELDFSDSFFDVICYFDGFGIGTDEDQIRLLNLMKKWLKPDGTVLIDIYSPYNGCNMHGSQMNFGECSRQYNFDSVNCRLLDTWWSNANPDSTVTQNLRCYSPADLKLLLSYAGMSLNNIYPNGGFEPQTKIWKEETSLECCFTYLSQISIL